MQRSAAAAETISRAQEATPVPPGSTPRVPNQPPNARPRRGRPRQIGVSTAAWSLAGTQDLVQLCRLLHEAVTRRMDATIFFLGLYDPGSETVEVVWQIENGDELPGGSFPLGKGFT